MSTQGKLKQRIYLPEEYAQLVAQKAHANGVSPDFYVQTLIAQAHFGGVIGYSTAQLARMDDPHVQDNDGPLMVSGFNWEIPTTPVEPL